MNIAEIEGQLSDLVERPFDPNEFPLRLLKIYNAPKATVTKLRKGTQNKDAAGVAMFGRLKDCRRIHTRYYRAIAFSFIRFNACRRFSSFRRTGSPGLFACRRKLCASLIRRCGVRCG
jgi:hypothetical protein